MAIDGSWICIRHPSSIRAGRALARTTFPEKALFGSDMMFTADLLSFCRYGERETFVFFCPHQFSVV